MMFWSEPLKVVLATVHVPLASVPAVLTREVIDNTIAVTARELPRLWPCQSSHRGRWIEPSRGRKTA
jgi:4-hydroxy-L-threonine phosphate dehydrogenase PdxA